MHTALPIAFLRFPAASLRRWSRRVTLLLVLWSAGLAVAQAQAPPPAVPPAAQAPAAPGAATPAAPAGPAPIQSPLAGLEFRLRFHFVMLDQYAFNVHPYFQITNDPGYSSAKAMNANGFNAGLRTTSKNETTLAQAVHALPPFGVEWVAPLNLFLPRGFSLGFDYAAFSQSDVIAGETGATVVPITTDTYLYMANLKIFAFDPTEPGLNYFFGIGVGGLEGKMIVPSLILGEPEQTIAYSQTPIGATRVGLETKGENWGFRYELLLVNADEVKLGSNPYQPTVTTIDFTGIIIRLALFYEFH